MVRRISLTLLLAAIAVSANASVLYSFEGKFGSNDSPTALGEQWAGWNAGDEFHGSFLWSPETAVSASSICWDHLVSGLTFTTAYTTIVGTGIEACVQPNFAFISSITPLPFGAVVPPGFLDDFFINFENSGTPISGLPSDLSAFTPRGISLSWLFPGANVNSTFELHARSVPEPPTTLLLFSGLAFLLVSRRLIGR